MTVKIENGGAKRHHIHPMRLARIRKIIGASENASKRKI
jgi:hypothetical protein